MKKLFMLLLMLGSLTAFSMDSDSTQLSEQPSKISETERIIDKYGGKIAESFNSIVEKITPVAEEGFKLAVRLQIAKGIASLLPLVLFIISVYLFSKEYNRIDGLL